MCLVHLGCQMQFSLLLIAVPCCLSRHVAGMWSAERWQDRMSAQVCGCLLWTQLLIQACHSRDALLKIGTVILKSSTDWRMRAKSLQLYLTLCDPMDCSPPGSSVHGILQARILEWVAMPFFRGSSWPRDWTHVYCISCFSRQILYHWDTWEAWTNQLFTYKCVKQNNQTVSDHLVRASFAKGQTTFCTDFLLLNFHICGHLIALLATTCYSSFSCFLMGFCCAASHHIWQSLDQSTDPTALTDAQEAPRKIKLGPQAIPGIKPSTQRQLNIMPML